MSKVIRLKYLLEFHIFLCFLGPILILFHTAFKFGGIVSVAFWSMVAVVLSGIIGRFIYIQIPRTIEGRELSLNEVKEMKTDLSLVLSDKFHVDDNTIHHFVEFTKDEKSSTRKTSISQLKRILEKQNLPKNDIRKILKMAKHERSLSRKINRLKSMQKLFKYWHVAHLPFALIMLVIVITHIVVTLVFGYKWIF